MLLCVATFAQVGNQASLEGTITDPTGAVIPNATITLTEVGTGNIHTATTENTGFYVATNLPIGQYTVAASMNGYRGEKRSGLIIRTLRSRCRI